MADTLQVHLDDRSGVVVTCGPVIYVIWREHTALRPVEVAEEVVTDMVRRYGDNRKLFYVHRAPAGAVTRQSPGVRDAVMKHFERHDDHFVAAAVAIEAEGFSASVVRSVTAGVMLVRRTPVKTEVFSDARAGLRWLGAVSRTSNPFDAESMVTSLEAAGYALTG